MVGLVSSYMVVVIEELVKIILMIIIITFIFRKQAIIANIQYIGCHVNLNTVKDLWSIWHGLWSK